MAALDFSLDMNNSTWENLKFNQEDKIHYCKNGGLFVLPELKHALIALGILGITLNSWHLLLAKKEQHGCKSTSFLLIQVCVVQILIALVSAPGLLVIDKRLYDRVPVVLLETLRALRPMAYLVHYGIVLLSAIEQYFAVIFPLVYRTSSFAKLIITSDIAVWIFGIVTIFVDITLSKGDVCILEGYGPYTSYSVGRTIGVSTCYVTILIASGILYVKSIVKLHDSMNKPRMQTLSEKYECIMIYFILSILLSLVCLIVPVTVWIFNLSFEFPAAYFSYTDISLRLMYTSLNPLLYFATNKRYREQTKNYFALNLTCCKKQHGTV